MQSISRVALGLIAALLLGLPALAQEGPGGLPAGPGADLVFAKCQSCHSLQYVKDSAGLPLFLWEDTVDEMIRNGLELTEEEYEIVIEYLGTYMGPNPPEPAAVADAADTEAAEGAGAADSEAPAEADGAAVYAANCASCHQGEGQGVPGVFPPLAGHTAQLAVAEGGRDYLVHVLLYGVRGEIEVQGTTYDGVMPAWAHLSDAQLAAVLNHLIALDGDGADVEEFTPDSIAEHRGEGLSAQDVLEARPDVNGSN